MKFLLKLIADELLAESQQEQVRAQECVDNGNATMAKAHITTGNTLVCLGRVFAIAAFKLP